MSEREPAKGDDSLLALPARRRLLLRGVAAAGLMAAAAAEFIARPAPAEAGTDGDVVLGSRIPRRRTL